MGYGDDIISSDNFEADDEEEFDTADYETELGTDDDIDWEDDELAGR
jgi:hypothetical protein